MAITYSKSSAILRLLSHNGAGKRVVSTSTNSPQGVKMLTVSDVIQPTCPFRKAFETAEHVLKTPKETAKLPTSTKSELKPFSEVPGPKGLPIVGSLFDYIKKDGFKFSKMFEAQQKRAMEYGTIYKEKIATMSGVIISDPEEYSKVIRAEGLVPIRKELEPMAHYRKQRGMGLGLVNSQGEEWHKYRTVTSKKMLKLQEVATYCNPMSEVATDFVQYLSSTRTPTNEVDGLQQHLFKWAMESIGTFLFDQRLGCFGNPQCQETKSFIDNLLGFFHYLQPLIYNVPVYKIYPTKLWKTYESYSDNVLRLGRYFVDKKLKDLQLLDSKDVNEDKSTFLSYLLSHERLTKDDAIATAIDLLVSGTETTTNATLWSLYCLGKNPEVQETFYNEIKEVVSKDEQITPEMLNKLPYAKAVLKETLRLFPITFATSRVLQSDVEIAGYNVPSGTHVQANLYGMYRDPALFPDPEAFKPERWLRKSSNMNSTIKGLSNLIWGHGPRMCVGRRIAEQEIRILLTKIVQNFKLEYDHEDVEPVLKTVMTPDRPVQLRFVPRTTESTG